MNVVYFTIVSPVSPNVMRVSVRKSLPYYIHVHVTITYVRFPLTQLPSKTFITALRGYYAPTSQGADAVPRDSVVRILRQLPTLSVQAHNDSITSQLNQHHPGLPLASEDQAIIMFIDDGLAKALKLVDMEFRVEAIIRNLAPLLAADALEQSTQVLKQPSSIYALLEQIIKNCAGWSEDLGILGQKYMEKTEASVLGLCRARATPQECLEQLNKALRSEHRRYQKLEENLINAESQQLIEDAARRAAAEMINQKMAGQPLAMFMIFMLQGAWYEFMQKVFEHYGDESEQWLEAEQLTEQLIWSLQPQSEQQKQQTMFTQLPKNITQFASTLCFDTEFIEPCLADIEAEHDSISDGHASTACDFELLEAAAFSNSVADIEKSLLSEIEKTPQGRWYLYDDKADSDEKIARIKLIINDPKSARLVFTNQNRRKVLTMTYMEFAGRKSNHTIKPQDPEISLQGFLNKHLAFIITTIKAQKARELKEREAQQRRLMSKQFLSRQQMRISDEMQQIKQRAALKKRRALLLQQKAETKLMAAHDAVSGLRPDAWMKLPLMAGTQTPCKLVAVVSSADKYIFANRAGIKVAEYSANQLSHMIVAENSEILDTGAEFENALASVISGLRESKAKSYDQLTGSA